MILKVEKSIFADFNQLKFMKHTLSVLFLILFISTATYSQGFNPENHQITPINSFEQLSFLKETLKGKDIVLLGEQTHGDGAVFKSKVQLIKYLHQALGFELIAFEAGMYDNYKAAQLNREKPSKNHFYESIYPIWSDTEQFKELLDYVESTQSDEKPLQIVGFDNQEGSLFQEYFFKDVKQVFQKNNIELKENQVEIIKEIAFGGIESIERILNNKTDSTSFSEAVNFITDGFKKCSPDNETSFLNQVFESFLAEIVSNIKYVKGEKIIIQNPRDAQMAKNFNFLKSYYPNKKIIGWGASFHFASNLEQVQFTELTNGYIERLKKQQNQDSDEKLTYEGAIPMGQFLKEKYGDTLYSLGFSTYQGTYGLVGDSEYEILTPPEQSFEDVLHKQGFENAFVNFNKKSNDSFYASPLGYLPLLAPWQKTFDGMVFMKEGYPPSYVKYEQKKVENANPVSFKSISGKVIDKKSGLPVPYAHITLKGTSIGTVTNGEGLYSFNFKASEENADFLEVSSIGYKAKSIPLALNQNNQKELIVSLEEETRLLDEVTVSAKELNPKEIIKKARNYISQNYYQQPYNQELFYRVHQKGNDSTYFLEEASVLIYDESGYEPSTLPYKKMYGEILQFRNNTKNATKQKWAGVGTLWLVFTHDLILDKDNILHRTAAYEPELTDIISYQNEEIYVISFTCKRPSSYTTGFGYPAPKATFGKLYISTTDYAVLKYEHCIQRQDYKPKKKDFEILDGNIQLLQTYQRVNGKYFLSHSKQISTETLVNKVEKPMFRFTSYDLLSTEVITDQLQVIEKPLDKIKIGFKPKNTEDSFWQQHNFVFEDDDDSIIECGSNN